MPDMHAIWLQRWNSLWKRWGVPGDEQVLSVLLQSYAAPQRYYHNLRHLQECLEEFDAAAHLTTRPEAVETALWFHDAIYDARAADNEVCSADGAATAMRGAALPAEAVEAVWKLVLATRHIEPPHTADEALIVDIDLAILAAEPPRFYEYEGAIRQEYAHVPDDQFRAGRAAVLRRFLNRPAVYHTEVFRSRPEERARSNLHRSLATLERADGADRG